MTSKMTPKMTPKSIRIDPGAQQVISQKPLFFLTKPHILSFGHPPWTPKRRPRNTLRIRLDFLTIFGSKNDSKMTPGRPKRQPRIALKIRLDFLTILTSKNDSKMTPGRPKRQPRIALRIRLDFLTILTSKNEPKMAPKWAPGAPKMTPGAPKMTPRGWGAPQERPGDQNDPKMIAKWV